MKQPKRPRSRKQAKSAPPLAQRKEQELNETEHLLEEVAETNKHISDPADRERVVPSRPC